MNLKVSNKSSEKPARGVSFWLKVMFTARWEAQKPKLNDLTCLPWKDWGMVVSMVAGTKPCTTKWDNLKLGSWAE